MTAEQLETEFESRGTRRGGILVLSPDDAIALVRRARDVGIAILGLDAFQLTDSTIQPIPEYSPDYSASGTYPTGNTWAEAERLLSRCRASSLMFEVVLER